MIDSKTARNDQPRTEAILNVNDSEATRYMITRMLKRAGFAVIEAASGEQALELVHVMRPRLVVLDVKLPDISGLDVCRHIKSDSDTRSIKVLHTSAVFVATEYKVQSLDSGADGYLTHPFEQEELVATVRSLLRLTEAEQALRDRAEELNAANRRTNEFLAMLAHELRNPLAAIVTSLPLLERRAAQDKIDQMARDLLRRQTTHLARLVDDLLDVARVTQGKIELEWEKVDLAELLKRVVSNIEQTKIAAHKQILRMEAPAQPVLVRGDTTRLEQIFTNLLDNASKYTDDGGAIHAELRLQSAHGVPKAVVIIRDSGIGISADTLPTIFNLFSQADVPLARTRGGLGIGLTLVKTLVDMHGGSVTARSGGPSKGSEFEVTLPLIADAVRVATPSETQSPDDAANSPPKRRVLVIEDNLDAQQALQALLEMCGHDVAVAPDGETGIAKIFELRPDIAIIDLGLPSLDGYEVARRVRLSPQGKDLLLVALTGYGAPEQRSRALEAGFDLHLVKPVEPEQLLKLVAERAPPASMNTKGMETAGRIRVAKGPQFANP
jgi:signal transduction histidine kinase